MSYERREGESLPAFAAFLLFAHLPPEEVNFFRCNGQRMDRFAAIADALQVRVNDVLAWRDVYEWGARKSGGFRGPPLAAVPQPTVAAMLKILDERGEQRRKWDDQHDRDHDLDTWIVLFTERLGKVATAYIDSPPHVSMETYVAQLGALCMAYLESRE